MKKRFIIAIAAVLLLFTLYSAADAYDNTLNLTGSYGSTFLGLEYERRFGNFGVGLETSMMWSKPYYASEEGFPLRFNGILRYYFDVSRLLKPYISLAPGALIVIYPATPEQVSYNAAFNMHATAGLELTPGNLRFAVEGGYEFITVFLYPEPVSEGWFFLKGAVGIRF